MHTLRSLNKDDITSYAIGQNYELHTRFVLLGTHQCSARLTHDYVRQVAILAFKG